VTRFLDLLRGLPSQVRHPLRTKPLRVRLMALVLVLLAVAMSLIGVASVAALHRYLVNDLDNSLKNEWNNLVESARHPLTTDLRSQYYGGVSSDSEGMSWQSFRLETTPADDYLPNLAEAWRAHPEVNQPYTVTAPNGEHWRVYVNWVDSNHLMMMTATQHEVEQAVQRLITIEIFGGISVLLFAGTIGAELIRRSMRPLSQIEKTASAIAAGDLSQRVPDPEPDNPVALTEVGSLSRSLNTMLAQIEAAFTAQAESEAAARRSEERMRRFIADASHELRTPLTTIRGFAELYRQGAVTTPEKTAEVVQRIENEASRMGLLVEDLLLLARLDRERPIRLDLVEMRVLASEAVEAARVMAPDRDITLSVPFDAGPLVVTGDDARLRQVIGNLVSNALTHTPAGTPVIVRLTSRGGQAVLEVHDRGEGLSREQQERVFERFYRADPARTRRSDGSVPTGLGLAIVAALVAAHSGTVEVDSQPGEGATFRVLLPLAELTDEDDDAGDVPHEEFTPEGAAGEPAVRPTDVPAERSSQL
jgi:two-component system, OmpR family, sensor kinase